MHPENIIPGKLYEIIPNVDTSGRLWTYTYSPWGIHTSPLYLSSTSLSVICIVENPKRINLGGAGITKLHNYFIVKALYINSIHYFSVDLLKAISQCHTEPIQ